MKFSLLAHKKILNLSVGGIFNKFKIRLRRNTLFFEKILAKYIDTCEKAGHAKEMRTIGFKWAFITTKVLVPKYLKKLPLSVLGNKIIDKLWKSIGLMDKLNITTKNNIIVIKTKKEFITRLIGKNEFMNGFGMGVLSSLFKSVINPIKSKQTKKKCEYTYKIIQKSFDMETKKKKKYNKLNQTYSRKGMELEDYLKGGFIEIKNNRIFFKGSPILYIENTIFHLIGNKGILLESIEKISYNHFKTIIEPKLPVKRKLLLLKNLLQVLGWGLIDIKYINNDEIVIEIKNPPFGLQKEEDNWIFLSRSILGYLWLINKKLKIIKSEKNKKQIRIYFS